MRILWDTQWKRGFLDYARDPGEYRISVLVWRQLARLDDARIVRSRSPIANAQLVLEYMHRFGPAATVSTLRSRPVDAVRHQKYVACGLGRILEGPEGGLAIGQVVAFLAPHHPACVERLVAHPSMVCPVDEAVMASIPSETLLFFAADKGAEEFAPFVRAVQGWSRFSGSAPAVLPDALREYACDGTSSRTRTRARVLSAEAPEPVRTGSAPVEREGPPRKPAAVLVGYGQHARTIVLPAIHPHLEVTRIHEIDPTVSGARALPVQWSTSASLGEDLDRTQHRAVFVAGYHHTHVPLAIEALSRGLYAVIEKPLATEARQLDPLLRCLRRTGPRLFVAYQRRYHPFNPLARADLAVLPGDPVSYHCIVYEHPLPSRHWYRWPNTRSRVLSNGCHWIDHFLFLNGYAGPVHTEVYRSSGGVANCSIELSNGALFTMTLADNGSGRRGVHDYIELRAGTRTVRITDSTAYLAESDDQVLRRASVRKLEVFRRMYEAIALRILAGGPGDSLRSTEVSARLVLAMDQQFREAGTRREWTGPPARLPVLPPPEADDDPTEPEAAGVAGEVGGPGQREPAYVGEETGNAWTAPVP